MNAAKASILYDLVEESEMLIPSIISLLDLLDEIESAKACYPVNRTRVHWLQDKIREVRDELRKNSQRRPETLD
jgi:hypothetical protein